MSKAAELANLIGNINAGGGGVNRNVIINGAMNVAQRGTSFTLENNSAKFPVDRFFVQDVNSSSGEATVSQSTTAPTDFKNSLKVDVTTADTALAANDQYKIEHRIEGQNIKHFNFGTSSAKTLALSFYIRSNKTGNTSVALLNNGNDRAYVATFTIDSANTWERKKITIEGDSSGTWLDTNGIGLRLRWGSFGSTYQTSSVNQWVGSQVMSTDNSPINFFDSTDNELYLTGVQLEIGQNATTFEHEPFETTLARCKRYFQKSYNYSDAVGTVTNDARVYWQTSQQWGVTSVPTGPIIQGYITLHPSLRATATVVPYSPVSGTANRIVLGSASSSDVTPNAWLQQAPSNVHIGYPQNTGGAGFANDDHVLFHWTADSEL